MRSVLPAARGICARCALRTLHTLHNAQRTRTHHTLVRAVLTTCVLRSCQIIRYPAAFLVLGVMCLFSGFCIGICLFYGIGVAFITGGSAMVAFFIYERFYAHGTHSETFNALSVSVGALFFRSCLPDMARQADEHPAAAAAAEDADGGHPGAGAEAVDADEEAERGERKRAEWEERAGAIGKAVAEQLRSEPVIVRRDPRDDTRAFAKKGCCK